MCVCLVDAGVGKNGGFGEREYAEEQRGRADAGPLRHISLSAHASEEY